MISLLVLGAAALTAPAAESSALESFPVFECRVERGFDLLSSDPASESAALRFWREREPSFTFDTRDGTYQERNKKRSDYPPQVLKVLQPGNQRVDWIATWPGPTVQALLFNLRIEARPMGRFVLTENHTAWVGTCTRIDEDSGAS